MFTSVDAAASLYDQSIRFSVKSECSVYSELRVWLSILSYFSSSLEVSVV